MDESFWDERYSVSELVWTADANRFVVRECADLRPGDAVELACGEGRNAVWLARHGWRVTGIDFSRAGLAKAERLAGAWSVEVRWEHADVTRWQPARTYDLVVIAYLQLAPAERALVLRAAAAATAVAGSLLVVAHDARNLEHGVGGPQDASVLWTPDEVDVAGFHPVRRETAQRETPAGVALDTVVRLVRDA